MKIAQEIKKAIYAKYQTSTLFTVDAVPLYLDHVPASVAYPIIVVHPISSGNSMAMPSLAQPTGFDYEDGRWQFMIYGNDRQHVQIEDIADRLEDLFHRSSLPTGNGVTHIATISIDQYTTFWDQQQKIWTLMMQFRILAGR